jgi:hypothetical protein
MSHLIILQNGLNGASKLMYPIRSYLETHLQPHMGIEFHIETSNVNDFHHTWDGLDAGGQRLAQFTKDKVKEHSAQYISFIGHSLGGLLARNCIGVLNCEGFFDHVQPVVYASIASPHLGVLSLPKIKELLARWVIYKTGPELLIEDPKQLLVEMSSPGTHFMAGLGKFKIRIAYGNFVGDTSVPFESACICGADKAGRVYSKDELFAVDPVTECEPLTEPMWPAVICDNLSALTWDRQAIDLSDYWSIHNAIAGKSFSRHKAVLADLVGKLSLS